MFWLEYILNKPESCAEAIHSLTTRDYAIYKSRPSFRFLVGNAALNKNVLNKQIFTTLSDCPIDPCLYIRVRFEKTGIRFCSPLSIFYITLKEQPFFKAELIMPKLP